ncbi:VOC family protein [Vibrio diabolicus]|uniref:VOC family protein n=1 Tax=Vibrio diabolicus TaxID=50719 RepID=UPI00215E70CB|nr:VOC family protein [Vibrio diabolicus]MCS0450199.1 VOC family protein [Vibrio diabolicus]
MTTQLVEKRLTPELMIQDLDAFMAKIEELATLLKLDLSFAQADHIALRINDTETAKAAYEAWNQYGKVISQAKINGRPIIVIEFDKALESRGWKIECLELPYPAEGKIYPNESWEHVEFVIPSHAETADEFLADLKHTYPAFGARFDELKELGVKIKLSSPKGEGERLNNPTVAFKYQGICIKLHPHSLKRIVESEQAE